MMNVRFLSKAGGIVFLGVLLVASGCGGGGGGGGGGTDNGMSIVSCSLGCTAASGPPGAQYSCGVTEVFVNQEIRLDFTNPVDLTTVNNNSFQVVESVTGKTPPGAFAVATDNPRTLIYRPQLSFDSSGNPIFGLTSDKTYFLRVPGSALDTLGPFIRGLNGSSNASRMQCTLVASRGVFDARPGRPRVAL